MNLTRTALNAPAAIAVIIAMVTALGLFSIEELPVQLFPDIERPRMSVFTQWRAAAPYEVESELMEPQEDVLSGIPGMTEMQGWANAGGSWINLEFQVGTDMRVALLEVMNRLTRLPPLPADAEQPVINMGGDNDQLIYFFLQMLPGSSGAVEDHLAWAEAEIKPELERIDGVAQVEINAGARTDTQELVVQVDPARAAALSLPLTALAPSITGADDISGGFVDIGRRQYTVRFTGKLDPAALSQVVVARQGGRNILLGEVADVAIQPVARTSYSVQNNFPASGVRLVREPGANVLATLEAVKAKVAELNAGPLIERNLRLGQSFDASVFIKRAIGLVGGNLLLGMSLAIVMLWWFLRRWRATLLVALSIPICLFATLICLAVFGRTVNVISLAGIAFAVGMVLDASIVVQENIVRLREKGVGPFKAAFEGTTQVWPALLASTATTVAIFIPVLFLEDVEGQVFAELALTIAIAVSISLVVAVTVLPVAARRWLGSTSLVDHNAHWWAAIAKSITRLTDAAPRRLALIATLVSVPIIASYLLLPRLDYLPPVKRDAVDAFLSFPPGASQNTVDDIVATIVSRLKPYMDGDKEPVLKNYYVIVWPGGGTIGVRAQDQSRVDELQQAVQNDVLAGIPDFRGFAAQGNLFGGFDSSRGVAINLQGEDTRAIAAVSRDAEGWIRDALPGVNVQINPQPDFATPELRISPKDARLSEVGFDRRSIATVVRTLGDGMWLGEYFDGEQRVDMILRADGWTSPEELAATPVATPTGAVLPLGELIDIEQATGPGNLQRVNGRRTMTLGIEPPQAMSLDEVITILESEVEPKLRAALPAGTAIIYGGSADSMRRAVSTLGTNFLMAFLLLFLLLAALFKSLKDSAMVVVALPLAAVGGVLGLRALNLISFQPLDLLTMIGFIILLGLVVNNAILLVHQTRAAEREGATRRDAVHNALRVRLRPILMSTLTSILGMLPLVIMAGPGSVIYRGLATVIVGGMSVSLIFTLILLPCLLRLGQSPAERDATLAASLRHTDQELKVA